MPATPAIASRIVTGTIVLPDGTPAEGSVRFLPSVEVRDVTGLVTVARAPLTVDLDSNGEFSIELSVTDDPDAQPQGWVWEMTTLIEVRSTRRFQLPSSSPSTVDVAQLESALPVELAPQFQYASVAMVNGALAELAATDADLRADVAATDADLNARMDLIDLDAAVVTAAVVVHPFLTMGA
jgi:hypothetical protein